MVIWVGEDRFVKYRIDLQDPEVRSTFNDIRGYLTVSVPVMSYALEFTSGYLYTLNDSNHSFDCDHKQCSNISSIVLSHQDLRKKGKQYSATKPKKIRSYGIYTTVSTLTHEPIILSSLNLKGSLGHPIRFQSSAEIKAQSSVKSSIKA